MIDLGPTHRCSINRVFCTFELASKSFLKFIREIACSQTTLTYIEIDVIRDRKHVTKSQSRKETNRKWFRGTCLEGYFCLFCWFVSLLNLTKNSKFPKWFETCHFHYKSTALYCHSFYEYFCCWFCNDQ